MLRSGAEVDVTHSHEARGTARSAFSALATLLAAALVVMAAIPSGRAQQAQAFGLFRGVAYVTINYTNAYGRPPGTQWFELPVTVTLANVEGPVRSPFRMTAESAPVLGVSGEFSVVTHFDTEEGIAELWRITPTGRDEFTGRLVATDDDELPPLNLVTVPVMVAPNVPAMIRIPMAPGTEMLGRTLGDRLLLRVGGVTREGRYPFVVDVTAFRIF